jgi:hypothetical protein
MLAKHFEARMILKENTKYWLNEYGDNFVVRNDKGFQIMQEALDLKIEEIQVPECDSDFE